MALSFNWPNSCADTDYAGFDNVVGQSACYIFNQIAPPCLARLGERPLDQSSCACNTVLYSLQYVCALCSNDPSGQTTFWRYADLLDCETFMEGHYPPSMVVPPDVPIPGWALLDLDPSGAFDVEHARIVVTSNQPASMPSPTDVSATRITTTISTTPTQAFTPSESQIATSRSSDSASPSATTASVLRPSAFEGGVSFESPPPTITDTNFAPSAASTVPGSTLVDTQTLSAGASSSSNSGTANTEASTSTSVPAATSTATMSSPSPAIRHWVAIVAALSSAAGIAFPIFLALLITRRRQARRQTGKAAIAAQTRSMFPHDVRPEVIQQMQETDESPRMAAGLPFGLYNPENPSTLPPPYSQVFHSSATGPSSYRGQSEL
ncbi:hypothetical protein PYCCODRAFT_351996 [Trametes coccinea BRFM310]|uniref:Uncharacterized protein n=1 Tax=Trametes coccinea (strain BRFM310) TaxID=1353009 RepID=A0A1Y2J6F4_TRAC3|nr:hypothetical protein PYCCODRAFT_351996 [Trametes coccinea BRFM310]